MSKPILRSTFFAYSSSNNHYHLRPKTFHQTRQVRDKLRNKPTSRSPSFLPFKLLIQCLRPSKPQAHNFNKNYLPNVLLNVFRPSLRLRECSISYPALETTTNDIYSSKPSTRRPARRSTNSSRPIASLAPSCVGSRSTSPSASGTAKAQGRLSLSSTQIISTKALPRRLSRPC